MRDAPFFAVPCRVLLSRVDAVDFHDSGDEGDGDYYDLIEDPESGEKYK